MDDSATHFTTVFMAFFAIMNPISNASLFLGLTDDLDSASRRAVAFRAVVLAFIIVALFTVLGRQIFEMFGITLPAFRIAGGILVGLVGYQLMHGQESSVQTPTAEDNSRSREAALGIAISPLALPILAGPGAIATAMNFAANSTLPEVTRVLAALALVCLITFVAFVTSDSLVRVLGQNAIKVVSRLMGLILAVIGVQMVIEGIRGAVAAS
ncbi:MAG TPA: NAAT family transporter [Myxococcales bacterium]|nr:NAAT family transporter [Myxococcales bacterium]HIM02788.1 NAAT family transporter [Myxococcales bacterium]